MVCLIFFACFLSVSGYLGLKIISPSNLPKQTVEIGQCSLFFTLFLLLTSPKKPGLTQPVHIVHVQQSCYENFQIAQLLCLVD